MLWFALFLSFSRSWMLVTPVLAAIFHLLRLGQAVTSTTALASPHTTKCREVFLQAKSSGVTVTTVSVFPWWRPTAGGLSSPCWGLPGCVPFSAPQPPCRCWPDALRAQSPAYPMALAREGLAGWKADHAALGDPFFWLASLLIPSCFCFGLPFWSPTV